MRFFDRIRNKKKHRKIGPFVSSRFRIGDTVNYHNAPDGPVVSSGHKIIDFDSLDNGEIVAFVTGIDEPISIDLISVSSSKD